MNGKVRNDEEDQKSILFMFRLDEKMEAEQKRAEKRREEERVEAQMREKHFMRLVYSNN